MFWWHLKSTYALRMLNGRNNGADDGYAIIHIQAHKILFRMHISFMCTCMHACAHTHTHTHKHKIIYIYIYLFIYLYIPRSPKQTAIWRPNIWSWFRLKWNIKETTQHTQWHSWWMKTCTGLHTFSAAYGCIKSARGLLKRNWMWQNTGASSWNNNYTTGWIIQVGYMHGNIGLPFPPKCPHWVCSPPSLLLKICQRITQKKLDVTKHWSQ